jgi:hypothetical protein
MMLRTLALTLALSAFAAPALAEDFTFVVPVDVRSLPPEITSMSIQCGALTAIGGRPVGTGETVVPITGGAYRGDVTVSFNASAGLSSGSATAYSCNIRALTTSARRSYYPNAGGSSSMIPLAPGATFRPITPETLLH